MFYKLTQTVPSADGIYLQPAYQVVFTDTSQAAADIGGFTVVFYDSSGTETGSDTETVSQFLTASQSWQWTETPWGANVADGGSGLAAAPFAAGQSGAVDTGATCQVVQWNSGQ